MKKQILAALLPLIFTCGCKTTKKANTDNTGYTELINDEAFRKPIVDKELFKATTEVVPLDTVFISKDTLNIYTKKINGCETDNFKLIWTGDLSATAPTKTTVKLFQLVEGSCKERHRFHLLYNISPLKPKMDTAAVKATLIEVGGWRRMNSYSRN